MPVASGDQCGIAAVSRDGVHLAGFVCVYKVILAQKCNESNRRAARCDLPCFGGIAIGKKPQIGGVTVFDGYERRTVPRNVEPLQFGGPYRYPMRWFAMVIGGDVVTSDGRC